MGSIRPLITITILVGVGAFLFTKINEVPVAPPENAAAMGDASTDVPPLAMGTATEAPAWNGSASNESGTVASIPTVPPVSLPAEVPSAFANPETAAAQAPTTVPADLPPIPELPPMGAVADVANAPSTSPAEASPIPMPANIPVAQYPGDMSSPTAAPAAVEPVEPVEPATPEVVAPPVASTYPPATAPATASPAAETVAPDDRYGTLATDTTSADATSEMPTNAPVAAPTPESITPVQSATPTFASEWPQIQGALARQELVAAHEMLSRWYGNPSLTPAESQQVEVLLSQLAGTVVYSTEHRLEPPYTVHAGDTLQTIAQQYDVPWQLLAKINGVAASNMVQPGQQLKVVHGPFSAVVELDKSQMTLLLDGRYAGRFPITLASDATVGEGKWVLEQKLVQPAAQETGVVSASYTAAVEHVLVLRNEAAAGQTISISAGPGTPSGPTAVAPSAIRLSPRDVEEVADILSVGSTVTIRR